jgi:ABC-type sugar transport system substrate-binding protein
VLVGAANDPSALGAVRAFQETGREGTCAIVGQNAEPDASLVGAAAPVLADRVAFRQEKQRRACAGDA